MKAVFCFTVLIFPDVGMAENAPPPADELVSLIERCYGNGREDELSAAVLRHVGKFAASPRYTRNRSEDPGLPPVRPNQDWLLTELGHHLLATAGTLNDGLPSVSRFSKPHRLGPLFDGMMPDRFEKKPEAMLQPLLPLVTPEWLGTAAACGAFEFVHTLRLLRGEINDQLRAYQQAKNETGLLRLGGVLGRYPELSEQVKPSDFATSTLALLLAGAFSDSNFQGQPAAMLAIACGKWSAHHPGLCDDLERITPGMSVALCRVARCQLRGEREEAQRLIASINDYYQESVRQLLHALQSAAEPAGQEAAAAARAMTSGQLIGVLSEMLDINKHDDREVERAMPLLRELLTRRDLPDGPSHSVCHLPHVREVAQRWWMAGNETAACELEMLAFLTDRPTEPYWGLNWIVELAQVTGKDMELSAAVERQAALWGERRFTYHRQAMREAAGQISGAADHSRTLESMKILDALCGDPGTARECFAKLPREKQADFAAWLILTGNQDVWKEAVAAPAEAGGENTQGFAGRGIVIRVPAKPGGRFDPKSASFLAFDAMGEVKRLLDVGATDQARNLFRQARGRCLFDDSEPEPMTFIVDGLADRPCGWVGRDLRLRPRDMLTLMIACWDLDASFLREHVLLEMRRGLGVYWPDHGYLPLALYLVRCGDYAAARNAAIRYQSLPTNPREQHRILFLAWIDGLAQAAAGRTNNALLRLNACMALSPADTAPGKAIMDCLEKNGGSDAGTAAKAAVRKYWESKRLKHPDDPAVREAAQRWLALLKSS